MNITFINGSPKAKDSASQAILNDLKTFLPSQNISEIHFSKPRVTEQQIKTLKKSEVIVFSFPLYIDSVPSNLLACMITLEKALQSLPITVFAISNNGFYEGIQNRYALDVIKNWSLKTKLTWGQGVGVGCGGMMAGLENVPVGKGLKKNFGKALSLLSGNIHNKLSGENIYINANFPRFLYKLMAHIGWRQEIRKNGKKAKDLYRKL
jgi:hypothetical protein